jgi:hypothetical protein
VCSLRSALKLKYLCCSHTVDIFTWYFNRDRPKIGHKFCMEYRKLVTWRLSLFLRLNETSFTYSESVYVKYYELSIQCSPFWNVRRAPDCFDKNTVHLMKMSTEHWWNDTDSGKHKYSKKTLFYCLNIHHKSHVAWLSDRIQASAVRGRRRITWANARPVFWHASKFHINLRFWLTENIVLDRCKDRSLTAMCGNCRCILWLS